MSSDSSFSRNSSWFSDLSLSDNEALFSEIMEDGFESDSTYVQESISEDDDSDSCCDPLDIKPKNHNLRSSKSICHLDVVEFKNTPIKLFKKKDKCVDLIDFLANVSDSSHHSFENK